MTLSFSQLESARRNPAKFGSSLAGGGFYNANNFRTYLVASINRFHRGDTKEQVLDYFEERCRAKLTLLNYFETRLSHYKAVIGDYCDDFGSDGSVFIETNKKVSLAVGSHLLKGRIDRFDLRVPAGYRLTTAQLRDNYWQSELRWPLMQSAIATELNCATSEIDVGTFCFETGNINTVPSATRKSLRHSLKRTIFLQQSQRTFEDRRLHTRKVMRSRVAAQVGGISPIVGQLAPRFAR